MSIQDYIVTIIFFIMTTSYFIGLLPQFGLESCNIFHTCTIRNTKTIFSLPHISDVNTEDCGGGGGGGEGGILIMYLYNCMRGWGWWWWGHIK